MKDLSAITFRTIARRTAGLLVIEVWAPWCAPCRAWMPILQELADHYRGRVSFAEFSVDDDPRLAVELGVRGVPTLIFMRAGVEIDRVVGTESRGALMKRIEARLTAGAGTAA